MNIAAALAGAVLVVFGLLCLGSGGYEVVMSRRPPTLLLGRGLFPRHRPQRSDSWTPGEWRRGGAAVSTLGLVLTALGAFAVFRH